MVSRMEKYYSNSTDENKRSKKNINLYKDIYEYSEYSNIEGIATIDKNNEVDITKVRNMLKNRENYKKQRQVKEIVKEEKEPVISREFIKTEEKNYDIREILNNAREKKPIEDTPRSLDNTNYNILKNLKMNNTYKDRNFDRDELKELIDTITNTSVLNKMNDNELGLNMFDFESTNGTVIKENDSIKHLLEQAKKYEENKNYTMPEIDNSFYTSSMNFNKDDFEDAKGIMKQKKSKKILSKILLFIGLLSLTTLMIFGFYYLIK